MCGMQATEPWSPRDHDNDSFAVRNGGCSGSPGPARGYHTYTMTGDAIIWTSTAAPAAVAAARSPSGPANKAVAAEVTSDGCRLPSTPETTATVAALRSPGSILDGAGGDESFDWDVGTSPTAFDAETSCRSPDAEAAAQCSAKADRYSEKEFVHGFIRIDGCDDSAGSAAKDGDKANVIDGRLANGGQSETDGGDFLGHLRNNDGNQSAARTNVDVAAAQRLAKRLYLLEGFKSRDVMKHLGKNNDFSRVVSEEYFRFYDFTNLSLVSSMRKFLKAHTLQGETYERERVLLQLSHRYVVCNPHLLATPSKPAAEECFSQDAPFLSEDACHTLTCAIMLLNTDLHGQNIGKKMTMQEFIENLEGLNEKKDFPKELLKAVFQDIRDEPLAWPSDDVCETMTAQLSQELTGVNAEGSVPPPSPSPSSLCGNYFIAPPDPTDTIEYKRGTMKRKYCTGPGGVKVSKGKRSWKAFFTVLRGAALYFAKDEVTMTANNLATLTYIRVHHALATAATDYKKSKHVMRLQTADQSTYLFQTSDQQNLEDWITTINLVAATTSAPELPAPVGSQAKFRRPLLPSSITTLNLRDQLAAHESKLQQIRQSITDHASDRPPARGTSKALAEAYADKEKYLQFEAERYRVYAELLRHKLEEYPELEPNPVAVPIGECEEPPASPTMQLQNANAFSATISWKAESATASDRGDTTDQFIGEALGMYTNPETVDTFL